MGLGSIKYDDEGSSALSAGRLTSRGALRLTTGRHGDWRSELHTTFTSKARGVGVSSAEEVVGDSLVPAGGVVMQAVGGPVSGAHAARGGRALRRRRRRRGAGGARDGRTGHTSGRHDGPSATDGASTGYGAR
ncbi:unnamed protein product [Danaus chrysippus]|uniref:(African queen) hypothetical protein n=1 Tax=Danaus chrysippus TaxID=151541 RepID=A0A8J2W7L2_9NEOP|nr:unnamed protein product [Danaus chrysippus]